MSENTPTTTQVGIILGSASDLPVAEKAWQVLDALDIKHQTAVASAHRTPQRVRQFIERCEGIGGQVFIAIAGMAAALPGVVAAETLLPVIGVPVRSDALVGLDALLSIVQMPPGIPVATVAINGGANAALLAAHMMGIHDAQVRSRLGDYRKAQSQKVKAAHDEAGLSQLVD